MTISTDGAPSARDYHIAVANSTNMIIWGGATATNSLNNGAIYSP